MNDYILGILKDILTIDSPSGYCQKVLDYCKKELDKLGYTYQQINNGNLEIYVDGEDDYTLGIGAHIDTLGLMITSIKNDGTLTFTNIGGAILPTLDGEYCRIMTRENQIYTGTILSNSPASHVYKDAKTVERTIDTMHIRIDEKVFNKEDVLTLGIHNGDYVFYDPKTEIISSGYIKSRFLDDKLSVAIIFGVLKTIKEENIILKHPLVITFSTFEEIGHGCSYINPRIDEFIAIDMGCVGSYLDGNEYAVSICAKDNSGPYHYDVTNKLIKLAKENQLNYVVDVFQYYSSDASAAMRGGANIKSGLIGAGVAASHGMERTHVEAMENTYKLLLAYIKSC